MAKKIFKHLTLSKIILTALIIRLALLPWTYHGDVVVNYWWGKFAVDFPLRGYYDWLEFGGYAKPDQPMLYILLYKTIREIYLLLHQIFWFLNTNIAIFPSKFMQWFFLHGNQVLEKFPIVLSDLFFIFLVYKFIFKQFKQSYAKISALVLCFYPPLVYNTAVWGSNDSLLNLLGLISVYLFYSRQHYWGVFIFTLCLLFKTSLIIFAPILFVIFLSNKPSIKEFLTILIIPTTISWVISKPFSTYFTPFWLINTYFSKILPGAMPQLTANAFNFWALAFGLQPRLDELTILGLASARNLSLVVCLLFYFLICRSLFINYSKKNILLSLVNISLITFISMTRMHERYTFPALVPLFLLCFYHKKFVKYFILLTVTHLLNVYNWWWYPSLPPLIAVLKIDLIIRLLSVLNISLTVLLFVNQITGRDIKNR
jgi:Gpi18-like mannosyltransferase